MGRRRTVRKQNKKKITKGKRSRKQRGGDDGGWANRALEPYAFDPELGPDLNYLRNLDDMPKSYLQGLRYKVEDSLKGDRAPNPLSRGMMNIADAISKPAGDHLREAPPPPPPPSLFNAPGAAWRAGKSALEAAGQEVSSRLEDANIVDQDTAKTLGDKSLATGLGAAALGAGTLYAANKARRWLDGSGQVEEDERKWRDSVGAGIGMLEAMISYQGTEIARLSQELEDLKKEVYGKGDDDEGGDEE